MQPTTILCALALMLETACSTAHRPVTSSVPMDAPHLGPSPVGDFVLGRASQPAVKLQINADGTYFAEHSSPIEFWPMMEGNKVYPQRIKPSAENGNWTWDRTTGTVTLTPEKAPNLWWWPIDRLQFDPTHPDSLAAGGGAVLERAEE